MERSIFIVEDDGPVRALLTEHLRRRGFDVLASEDAETAVRYLLEKPPFDLLITDIHLPALSGIDLLRLLQAHSPSKPVLVITGDSGDTLAREALTHGAAGYLLKPFELFELDAAVDRALGHLELVERLAETDPEASGAREFGIPIEWLNIADQRSEAGHGHGRRVERLAVVLAKGADIGAPDLVGAAARIHELGQLVTPDPGSTSIPSVTAAMLEHTAAPRVLRELIEAMADSGKTAFPRVDAGASLVVADRIDHLAVEYVGQGTIPPTAILRAIETLEEQVGDEFGEAIGTALSGTREILSAVWILSRGGYSQGPAREQP